MPLNKAQRRIADFKHDVYKAYNSEGRLLYVGISVNVFTRLKEHRRYATWMPYANHIDVAQYPNRSAAQAEEARAIRDDAPLYNVTRENAWGCEPSNETIEAFTLRCDDGGWYIDE